MRQDGDYQDTQIATEGRAGQLRAAWHALNQRLRELLVMRWLQGYSYEEIGRRWGVSPQRVRQLEALGRYRLHQFMRRR
jgi:RNA polymerase sigma factor (sigma-70 family)